MDQPGKKPRAYRTKKELAARIKPTYAKLWPNKRRTTERSPDFRGMGRDCRGIVLDLGLWVVRSYTGNPRLDLRIKDMDKPWQVPYDPDQT